MIKKRPSKKIHLPDKLCLATQFCLRNDEDRLVAHSELSAHTLSNIANQEFAPTNKQRGQIEQAIQYLGWSFLCKP